MVHQIARLQQPPRCVRLNQHVKGEPPSDDAECAIAGAVAVRAPFIPHARQSGGRLYPVVVIHGDASGEHAASVLAVVHERAAQIDTLTLLSPPDIAKLDADLAGKLKALEVPTLLLFGAVISPHPTSPGTQWRRAFAKAHLVYIYDAEEPVEAARPEAVASVMADFMARKDGFLVRQQDDRFHP